VGVEGSKDPAALAGCRGQALLGAAGCGVGPPVRAGVCKLRRRPPACASTLRRHRAPSRRALVGAAAQV
jgi:hypothetical protein